MVVAMVEKIKRLSFWSRGILKVTVIFASEPQFPWKCALFWGLWGKPAMTSLGL
jgi:hypothetical protein